jgi:EAL domain-containing protein (putative c-di-GMP-specific phosphodiesterase class I)
MLKEMDCLRAQGFYFDKPLPKEAFMKRLRMRVYSEKLVN